MALINYNLSVSGDCQNTGLGGFSVSFSGAVPPYTVQFTSPSYPNVTLSENEVLNKTNLFSKQFFWLLTTVLYLQTNRST